MKISKLIQVVSRSIGMASGVVFSIYFTIKALASVTSNSNVTVAIVGFTIFLIVRALMKERNKCRI